MTSFSDRLVFQNVRPRVVRKGAQFHGGIVSTVDFKGAQAPDGAGPDQAERFTDKHTYVLHVVEAGFFPTAAPSIYVREPTAGVKVTIGTRAKPDLYFKSADVSKKGRIVGTEDCLVGPKAAELEDPDIIMTVEGTPDPAKGGLFVFTLTGVTTNVENYYG